MHDVESTPPSGEPSWLTGVIRAEPRVPLVVPFMAYLLLMMLQEISAIPIQVAVVLNMIGAGWVIWMLRHRFPPLGRGHVGIAVAVGVAATVLWVGGQLWLDRITVGGVTLGHSLTFSLSPPFVSLTAPEINNPYEAIGTGASFWSYAILRACRAVLIVPIVEELFWRGFLLRAFVHWDRYETVPWGRFHWFAFVGTSLLSVVQHPGNWGVSIACWMLFNATFYWTKSLRCLMITHGVTNLALYGWIVCREDWRFW